MVPFQSESLLLYQPGWEWIGEGITVRSPPAGFSHLQLTRSLKYSRNVVYLPFQPGWPGCPSEFRTRASTCISADGHLSNTHNHDLFNSWQGRSKSFCACVCVCVLICSTYWGPKSSLSENSGAMAAMWGSSRPGLDIDVRTRVWLHVAMVGVRVGTWVMHYVYKW